MFKRWQSVSDSDDTFPGQLTSRSSPSLSEQTKTPFVLLRIDKITSFSHKTRFCAVANFLTGTGCTKLVHTQRTAPLIMHGIAERRMDEKIFCDVSTAMPYKLLYIEIQLQDDNDMILSGKTDNLFELDKTLDSHTMNLQLEGSEKTAKVFISVSLRNLK
jgi:hypothetical protein